LVTGRKKFAMDVNVPNALPTVVCRPPTINGTVRSVGNLAAIKAMPGRRREHVAVLATRAAIRGPGGQNRS
jgi:isoquinoline 1-oxidoreductase beta subunit